MSSADYDLTSIDSFDRLVWRLHHRRGVAIRRLAQMFGETAGQIEERLRSYEAATDCAQCLAAIPLPFGSTDA